jgi:hypothetical protein
VIENSGSEIIHNVSIVGGGTDVNGYNYMNHRKDIQRYTALMLTPALV